MFCKKCGKELPDSAVFCPGCGTQIVNTVNAEADHIPVITLNTQGVKEKKKKGKWLIPTIVSAFVLVIAAVVAAFWLFPGLGGGLAKERKPAAENHLEQNQAALKENFDLISKLIRNFYAPKDGSTKNSVNLKVNKDILELLGAQEQFGWLSDVKFSYDVTDKNNLSDIREQIQPYVVTVLNVIGF